MFFDMRVGLDATKEKLLAQIDEQAGKVRCKYVTTSPGQDLVYGEKRREAEAFMADTELSEIQTPHLRREAASSGVTRYEKAVEILTMAYQWAEVSSVIEDRRLEAKANINSASSVAQAHEMAVVDWSDL